MNRKPPAWRRFVRRLPLTVLGWLLATSTAAADPVIEGIRQGVERLGVSSVLPIRTEQILATEAVPRFYGERGFLPAWVQGGTDIGQAEELVDLLAAARSHGLVPDHYHLRALRDLTRVIRDGTDTTPQSLVALDLLCTDAFLVYASHLVSGHVNPESIDSEWTASRREVDLVGVLDDALDHEDLAASLERLLPDHPGYERLRRALQTLRGEAAAGGWSTIDDGPKIEPGTTGPRVRQLRRRLGVLPTEDDTYDADLEAAVRVFQERQGLEVDGVVGRQTLGALNTPIESRIRQVVLNLERWRWLPQELGAHYILVNIPAFDAIVVDEGRTVMDFRVIVGRDVRRTPVFTGRMTYLVLNPYWEVPPKLALQDKLPAIRKDPGFFQKEGMRVFAGWGSDALEIDPSTVNWNGLSTNQFPYRLRQDPGPRNALGQVKFMFPNKHNIYLHDTPARELFRRSDRSFSSGCIRVEHPLELASHVLRSEWTRARIDSVLALDRPVTLTLPQDYLVHLLYWTAWVREDGVLEFRRDLYGRDARLAAALQQEPPDADDVTRTTTETSR